MNKKLLIYILTMCIMLSLPIKSFAGEINDAESAILGVLGSVYEKDGHYWQVKSEIAAKASNYCMRDDVDLTWADYDSALAGVYGYVGYEYFNIIGDVPGYGKPTESEPQDPSPSVSEEPETPSEPEVSDTPQVSASAEVSTSTETKPEESQEPEIELTETISSNDDVPDETEPETTEVYYPDAIKVPDSYSSTENDAIAAMLQPSKDYSNQEHIKKDFPIGMVAVVSSLVVLVTAAIVLFIHRNKHNRRR